MHQLRLPALALVLLVMAACTDSTTAPSSYAPFSQLDLVVGTGAEATAGKTVTMSYVGWLYDATQPDNRGAQFDASSETTPFSFTLGSNQVIQGWEQGIPGMRVGGVRQLVIPSSLAYDGTRQGKIPPNATLIFKVSLVDVQ